MTYEEFANSMVKKDSNVTRKSVRSFAIKYAIMVLWCALAVSSVISSILGTFFGVLVMFLAVLLYVFSFDILLENDSYRTALKRVVKRWWLISSGVTIVCILINLFLV